MANTIGARRFPFKSTNTACVNLLAPPQLASGQSIELESCSNQTWSRSRSGLRPEFAF